MHRTRWTIRGVLALTISAVLVGSLTPIAQATSSVPSTATPTGANPDSDLNLEPGQAYLGWHKTTPMQSSAAQDAAAADALAIDAVSGIDVSGWQGNVDWASWWGEGKRFAYVKATEGTSYQNEYFAQQYNGSYNQGFIRGSYHFARPDTTSGATQADYFVSHGGGWSGDGKTLPGVLDIEFNPYGANCYGLSDAGMVDWIASFVNRYRQLTGRDAVIYTNTNWWIDSTGNSSAFAQSNPLWVANYGSSSPTLPAGWGYYTFHQYTDSPIDQNRFNGSYDRLVALATG